MGEATQGWARRRLTWLAGGAASGVASAGILGADGMAVKLGVSSDWLILGPGCVFGMTLGFLARAAGPRQGWRVATWVVACTGAHHLAVRMAVSMTASDGSNALGVGMGVGAVGALAVGTAAAVLFPSRGWVRWVGLTAMAGGMLGMLMRAVVHGSAVPWGYVILYVPWQAAVALAASFLLVPARRWPAVTPATPARRAQR